MEQRRGLKDLPIDSIDSEKLDVGEYAKALTEFIVECDTPMTIAIQGDWGSGKTSLMFLIKQVIDERNKNERKKIKIIEFNTWQYSQFGQADELTFALMSHFLDSLYDEKEKERRKTNIGKTHNALKYLKIVARAALVAGASFGGQADTMKEFLGSLETQKEEQEKYRNISPSEVIRSLRNEMEKNVQAIIDSSDAEKILVLIDDLDRLVPLKAVELLESLKLFLDVKNCVFVLACDYGVVVQGLKEKFKSDKEIRGKSFFDKIIQVPFNMPVGLYNADKYIQSLLESIGCEDSDEKERKLYKELIRFSVGFNPRNLKRLFNSLLLLMKVSERKKLGKELCKTEERTRILFAILCLQTAYEPAYRFIQNMEEHRLTDRFLRLLRDENAMMADEGLKELRMEMNFSESGSDLRNFCSFADWLNEALQINAERRDKEKESDQSEGHLNESEVKNFIRILRMSSVVSVDAMNQSAGVEDGDRSGLRAVVKELQQELENRYGKDGGEGGQHFRTFQARKENRAQIIWDISVEKRKILIFFQIRSESFLGGVWTVYKEDVNFCKKWIEAEICSTHKEFVEKEEGQGFYLNECNFGKDMPVADRYEMFKSFVTEWYGKLVPELANKIDRGQP